MAKLDDRMMGKVEVLLQRGNYLSTVAKACNINRKTLNNWMRWGKDKADILDDIFYRIIIGNIIKELDVYAEELAGDKYYRFFLAVEMAQGEGEVLLLEKIKEAANGDWKAAAFILERKFPERWGKNDTLKLKGDKDEPLEVRGAPHFSSSEEAADYWSDFIKRDQQENSDDLAS